MPRTCASQKPANQRGLMRVPESKSFSGNDLEAAYLIAAAEQEQVRQPFLVAVGSGMGSWRYRTVKRSIDVLLSSLMLLLCFIPGLIIAAAVALSSRGPVFYTEIRVGQRRRPFRIWKFRSMRCGMTAFSAFSEMPHFEVLSRWRVRKDCHDPRITAVGRFIRRWSLDELPQLFNVLKGDMSLVGPRPVVRAELPLYKHLVGFYLTTVPGLSGLWQVSGRSDLSFSARAKLDASYVKSWSLRQDFIIMARTIPAVLRRVGAR